MPKAPVRDIIIYYEEAGSGTPLVLLTGLAGDIQGWAFQVRDLSPHFRVIAPDNRGAGRTSAPDRPYSIPQMADDVAALLDSLGVAKAHVLGFSLGGAVAQELALADPGLVDKLVLVNTMASIEGYVRTAIGAWVAARRSNMSREQLARLTAVWTYSPELLDDEERFERAIANGLVNPYAQQDHAFLRQATALLAHDTSDRLGDVKAPTLVLHAEQDAFIPPRNGEKLASLIPGATFQTLPGSHIGLFEYPAEYNEAITGFLGIDAAVAAGATT